MFEIEVLILMATSKAKTRKTVSNSRKSDKRRGEIIRVAIERINARSYAQATMVEIAAALDLRDATLYHYFHDKRTLAYACHRASLKREQQLLESADAAGVTGIDKLRHFIHEMLVDSSRNGSLLYLGDYSYLDAAQRRSIRVWTDRLRGVLMRFIEEGMADGTIIPCEPALIVQLLLGMLIWLGKWATSVPNITVERLMIAIENFSFAGLEQAMTASGSPKPKSPGRAKTTVPSLPAKNSHRAR